MKIEKNITRVTVANTYIQRIMNGGGIKWETFKDTSNAPGPKRLIGGSSTAGFFGEVPSGDFITGDELARRIGLTAGVSQYSNEPWLKFVYMGKIEFAAKKVFRFRISWDDINSVNAIFGNRTINISGLTFKVRLFKGKTEGKQRDQNAYNGIINHNSEWNRLMLPICKNAPSNWKHKDNVNSPTENWNVGYTGADLMSDYSEGKSFYSWCQEYSTGSVMRMLRGYRGVSFSNGASSYMNEPEYGWRPVLELIN